MGECMSGAVVEEEAVGEGNRAGETPGEPGAKWARGDGGEDETREREEIAPGGDGPPDDGRDEEDGDGGGDDRRWVAVASFTSAMEAQIARLRVESADIDCFLDNEYIVATDWLVSNAVGGVKLMVPEEDAAEARELLNRPTPARSEEPVFDGIARCPRCGSEDVAAARFSRKWAFLSILLLGLPVPVPARHTRCLRCGWEWEAERLRRKDEG